MICIASSSYNNKREPEHQYQQQQHYKLFGEYVVNDDINLNRLAQECNNVLLPLYQKSINKLAFHFTKKGMLQELIYVVSQGTTVLKSDLVLVAVRHGHLDCLQYLTSLGVTLTSNLTVIAAKHGHLDCLRYLASSGVTFNADVTKVAATTGNLECLQFAIENGCIFELDLLDQLNTNTSLRCAKYLFSVGCPWTMKTTLIVTLKGDLELLQFVIENGCPYDEEMTTTLAICEHYDCFEYVAIKCGCPYDLEMLLKVGYEKYIEKQSIELLQTVLPLCDTFIRAQIEYMVSLPVGDFLAIHLYLGNDLFRAINAEQQGLLQDDFLPENLDWKQIAKIYYMLNNIKFPKGGGDDDVVVFFAFIQILSEHIQKLINEAPTTDKPLTVYRGVQTPYFLYDFERNPHQTFLHKGFMSTTLKRDVAMYFSKKVREENETDCEGENEGGEQEGGENEGDEQEGDGCTGETNQTTRRNRYMLAGTLQVGTKCLFYPLGSEILLSSNTQIKLLKQLRSLDHEGEYKVEFL